MPASPLLIEEGVLVFRTVVAVADRATFRLEAKPGAAPVTAKVEVARTVAKLGLQDSDYPPPQQDESQKYGCGNGEAEADRAECGHVFLSGGDFRPRGSRSVRPRFSGVKAAFEKKFLSSIEKFFEL
jgi:hypothetical protein